MHQPHSLSQDSQLYTVQDLSHTRDYMYNVQASQS
jgi:hypothetical protein